MALSRFEVAIRLLKDQPDVLKINEKNSSLSFHKDVYFFDLIFPPGKSNKHVYDVIVAEKLHHLIQGDNVTFMAYGQSGSGKTYTLGMAPSGVKDQEIGIIPQAIQDIFAIIQSINQDITFTIKVSYLEIYTGKVFDLFRKSCATLKIEETASGFEVRNLNEESVESAEEAVFLLAKGSDNRQTGKTAKNEHSSRSHGIFSINIEQKNPVDLTFKRSKLQFIDLAGPGQISTNETYGLNVTEAIKNNLDLLSLRNTVRKLKEDSFHVPYLGSNLTKLLKDSLGESGHFVLIACINQTVGDTLQFASDVNAVKGKSKTFLVEEQKVAAKEATKNLREQERIAELKIEMEEKLRMEKEEKVLKERILKLRLARDRPSPKAANTDFQHDCKYQMELFNLHMRVADVSENLDEVKGKYLCMIEEFKSLKMNNREQEDVLCFLKREILTLEKLCNLLKEERRLSSINEQQRNKELELKRQHESEQVKLMEELKNETIKLKLELKKVMKENIALENKLKQEEEEKAERKRVEECNNMRRMLLEEEKKLETQLKVLDELEEKTEIGEEENNREMEKEEDKEREEKKNTDTDIEMSDLHNAEEENQGKEKKNIEIVEKEERLNFKCEECRDMEKENNGGKKNKEKEEEKGNRKKKEEKNKQKVKSENKKGFKRFFKRLSLSQKDTYKFREGNGERDLEEKLVEAEQPKHTEKQEHREIDEEQKRVEGSQNQENTKEDKGDFVENALKEYDCNSSSNRISPETQEPKRLILGIISNSTSPRTPTPQKSIPPFSKFVRTLSRSDKKKKRVSLP